ncbi:hypothetical protein [Streptomyces sp. NBC_00829]|uniref:hypothetical protein n=1 Tax=Streptomyces sp. NBC_00829 TaxID=2903679 RepID=UPI0038647C88|nr:hypothetical protein OG293_33610 [Streptomyces sp. NBC_00829]
MSNADASGDGRLTSAERAELAELRHKVASLESKKPRHRVRSFFSAVLIVLAVILAPLCAVSVWTADIVGDTDRYVATVEPLASDPDVQAAVTNRITNAVMEHISVSDLIAEVAPEDRPKLDAALSKLSGPLTSGLKSLVQAVTARFVSSDAFATIWTEVNRRAHDTMVKALTGEGGGAVVLKGDQVTVDLAPVIDRVKQRLIDRGLTVAEKIPEVHTSFVVATSDQIGKGKKVFRLLEIMGVWLPIVAVLIAAAGVLLAVHRRRALIAAVLGIAVAVGILGIGLTAFRTYYLDALPASVNQAAASSVYETLIRFLRSSVRTVVTLGAVIALGAWLSGPGRWAVKAREMWRSGIGAVRGATGLDTGRVGTWVHHWKTWLNWGVVVVAAVVFALWDHPTSMVTIWLAIGVLALLAVVEFLDGANDTVQRRQPESPPASRPL